MKMEEENKYKINCENCLSEWELPNDVFEKSFEGIRADLNACPMCWLQEK